MGPDCHDTRSLDRVGSPAAVRASGLCITRARIVEGERALGREGVVIAAASADRGAVRNPWTTVLNQYRAHFRSLAAELGLTPLGCLTTHPT